MLSVLLFTKNSEKALAHTLAGLVPAVVDGLLRRVIVVDQGSHDDTRLMAEGAGCAFYENVDLPKAFDDLRTEWLLILKPGAILQDGWEDAVRRHMEGGQATARFSLPQETGLIGKLLGVKPSLDAGLLAPVSAIRPLIRDSGIPAVAIKQLKPVRLSQKILPPETTKGGA
ncbi:glycosyl transferase [Brucella gallinifaecis]|uniref:glycosyl transferase n=1 Tax=Brucella gallinifaecis TaxID=215590 RepID=UPI00235EB95A|nr:glycosyl transferase [Brucella gallinifaecis]